MAIQTQTEISVEGARALLAHLRDHPESRFKSPPEIAHEFDLPSEFVEQVLAKAEAQPSSRSPVWDRTFSKIYSVRVGLKRLMDDAAKHPTTFVVITTLSAELLLLLLSVLRGHPVVDLTGSSIPALTGPGVAIPFLMVCAQMVLFFRRGMVRFALFGALAYWVTGGLALAWLEWAQASGHPISERLNLCLLILFAHFAVSLIYAAAASFASLMGEYYKVLRENRRIEKMSRQELLERLFQLQARMASATTTQGPLHLKRRKLTALVKPRLYLAAVCVAFVLQLGSNIVLLLNIGDFMRLRDHQGPVHLVAPLIIATCLSLLYYISNFWFAYVAPSLKSALIVGLMFSLGAFISKAPWLFSNSFAARLIYYPLAIILGPLRDLWIAGIAGVIAAVQTKTLEDLNLQRNDEATLIAEQLKIQWRLAENACSTTVMVVDVVKSTQMKEGADPLAVEYSFRRLQQWIEDVSRSHGGEVRSVAGDGAVVSFPHCHNAYIAATEIQRRMADFNASWNRLPDPFRVRIGLHVGEVQGDLGKIQFAQVIDIAAHMQKLAPVGGVAATREVADSLGMSSFVGLTVQSDGHDVFLALNPTGI